MGVLDPSFFPWFDVVCNGACSPFPVPLLTRICDMWHSKLRCSNQPNSGKARCRIPCWSVCMCVCVDDGDGDGDAKLGRKYFSRSLLVASLESLQVSRVHQNGV